MAEKIYKYQLQTWAGRDKGLKCPKCHRGHGCYKEYVDEQGQPVDPDNHLVGKCDHETTCGYHLTPAEWFKQNPDERGKLRQVIEQKQIVRKPIEIKKTYVGMFWRNTLHNGLQGTNTFLNWVKSLPWNEGQLKALTTICQWYAIGTASDGRIIWWQIDEQYKVRTGKLMAYAPNGHRLKDAEGNSIGFGWVHSQLQKMGSFLPANEWELHQCLFGQHLLKAFPDVDVHLVESEKTAFLMSMLDKDSFSKHLWMATGGLYNLNAAKLQALKGRKIVCYPDTNGVEKWTEQIKGIKNAYIYTGWMDLLTDADPKGADIADLFIRKIQEDKYQWRTRILNREPVKRLIEELELTEV